MQARISANRFLFTLLAAMFVLVGLSACQAVSDRGSAVPEQSRWFNPAVFEGVDPETAGLNDVEFDVTFSRADGGTVSFGDCFDVLTAGDRIIAERDFARWRLLKANCEALDRYDSAPEAAISYWDSVFDFDLLKAFPATAIPYLGGQVLDGRSGTLDTQEPALTLLESSENRVKVSKEDMVVTYIIVARADFNRDGYQDLFVRLDWYIESAFGDGSDWVVLTRSSAEAPPMMLWRR